jgi:hypothetical protein
MTLAQLSEVAAPVRKAAPAERWKIGLVLGRARHDDPLFRWAIPDDNRRGWLLPGLFALVANAMRHHGEVHVTDGMTGAALWAPPGAQPVLAEDGGEFDRRLAQLVGADGDRVFPLLDLLTARDPAGWYLQFLGTDPARPGRGVETTLLVPVLAGCDLTGQPAELQATSQRDRWRYELHGFEVVHERTLPGSPPVWPMRRAAVPPDPSGRPR